MGLLLNSTSISMHLWSVPSLLALSSVLTIECLAHSAQGNFEINPFTINLSSKIPRLQQLVNQTRLPDRSLFPQEAIGANGTGIDLDAVTSFKNQWLNEYDWNKEQAVLNRYVVQSVKDYQDLAVLSSTLSTFKVWTFTLSMKDQKTKMRFL